MARAWQQHETDVIERYLQGKVGPITMADHEALHREMPNRSVAAIKKKILQIRENPVRAAAPRNTWEADEIRRLEAAFIQAEGKSKAEKLRNITHLFPGRSEKALTQQLRSKSPEIYYGRGEVHAREPAERAEGRAEVQQRGATEILNPRRPTVAVQDTDGREQQQPGQSRDVTQITPQIPPPRPTVRQSAANGSKRARPARQGRTTTRRTTTTGPQIVGAEPQQQTPGATEQRTVPQIRIETTTTLDDGLRRKFRHTWSRVADARRKLARIGGRTDYVAVAKISAILQEALDEVEAEGGTEDTRREKSKKAIYAAGTVLAQVTRRKRTRQKPKHVAIRETIAKLEGKVELVKQLRDWKSGNLTPRLKATVKAIKKAKQTPTQYIAATRDRIRTLERSMKHQKVTEDAQKIRSRFGEKPSIAVVRPRKKEKVLPSVEAVEEFYQDLYGSGDGAGRRPTPRFNDWLRRLSAHKEALTLKRDEPEALEDKISAALGAAASWKAPGEDGIPVGIYKLIPSARNYLAKHVREVLEGKRVITEKDVRGRVVLQHKSGDAGDPANYRPIALLNSDYKILTGVIVLIIKQRLPEWAVPKEQLAREGVWGTVHGMLQDKAISLIARRNGTSHYSAWVDFQKAYDSISHWQLRRLIKNLPIDDTTAKVLEHLTKKWSVRVSVGKKITKPIYVKRGVYQGDTMSPLLFVLMTAFVAHEVRTSREVTKAARGKQSVIVYMDDVKLHAPTQKSITAAARCVQECASEVGLHMNRKKCGVYTRQLSDNDGGTGECDENEEAAFLPRIREGYKYLGIIQLELDTAVNISTVVDKTLKKVGEVLQTKLAAAQKIQLINSTVITAATYVLGNMFSEMKRTSMLKVCRGVDTNIRRLLVEHKIKTYSTSTASVHLDRDSGGLGMRAVADEVELQYVRKGAYLLTHPDLEETRARYAALERKGWKNPRTDYEAILEAHGIDHEARGEGVPISEYVKRQVKRVRVKQQERWMNEWGEHMEYGRTVASERNHIAFHAYTSIYMDDWRISMLHAAAEDQIQGLGAIPAARTMCTRGCNAQLTAYHVASACPTPEFNTRHDIIVARVLRAVVDRTAPEHVRKKCQFTRATMVEEYVWGNREVKIRAGVAIKTDVQVTHNKPDILITLTNPPEVLVFEIAVSHLGNIRTQEKIKRARYELNSMADIDHRNVDAVKRDTNLLSELRHMYRCPVHLGILVIGAYGEALLTDEMRQAEKLLGKVGIPTWKFKNLIRSACYSSAVSTTNILTNRMALRS